MTNIYLTFILHVCVCVHVHVCVHVKYIRLAVHLEKSSSKQVIVLFLFFFYFYFYFFFLLKKYRGFIHSFLPAVQKRLRKSCLMLHLAVLPAAPIL